MQPLNKYSAGERELPEENSYEPSARACERARPAVSPALHRCDQQQTLRPRYGHRPCSAGLFKSQLRWQVTIKSAREISFLREFRSLIALELSLTRRELREFRVIVCGPVLLCH
jgi:hypothetical protein